MDLDQASSASSSLYFFGVVSLKKTTICITVPMNRILDFCVN